MELQQIQPNLATISWKRPYELGLKRAVDVALALIALAFLWPVMLIIALLIVLDSPGPALFVQTRIGRAGRPFRIFKFRTMKYDLDDSAHRKFMQAFIRGDIGSKHAESPHTHAPPLWSNAGHACGTWANGDSKAVYKPFSESQVTRVGRILRKTSLDELPQLVNILKGEMSLVGPRPNVPCEVDAYQEWHKARLSVLPGITGLAQINGRSGIDFDTIARYDIEYAKRLSLGLDLRIMLSTASSVISGKGAH